MVLGILPLCREAVGVFYSPSRLGKYKLGNRLLVGLNNDTMEEKNDNKIYEQKSLIKK